MTRVVCIVEGPGESYAVPKLLGMLASQYQLTNIGVDPRPVRANGLGNIYKAGGIEKLVRIAVRTHRCDAVVVLLDSEGGCPAMLARALSPRISSDCNGKPWRVVYAHRQYETWLANSAEDIRGVEARGPHGETCPVLDPRMPPPVEPDPGGNAKRYLESYLPQGERYQETRDQYGWTSLMRLALAHQRCPSFRYLARVLVELSREAGELP